MKKARATIIVLILVILAIGSFITANWIPGKYAVKENVFKNYEPYILVREVHYTGTGWVQVGNENGSFSPEEYLDINIVNGSILPQMEMYNEDYVNTFLCKAEYEGKVEHDAFEDEIDSYYIVEWYPVYPVLRDTILPAWMYPESFMTKQEVKKLEPVIIEVEGFEVEYRETGKESAVEDFNGIELGSSIYEISDKLGEPDEWIGSGMLRPVYFLEDNRVVVLHFEYPAACENLKQIVLINANGKSQIIKEK